MANAKQQLDEADVLAFLDVGVNTADNIHPNDPITKARIRVTLDQLRPYDNNPRQSENPKFESILASIESRGLDHTPNITRRRPDDEHYIIIDGGNTRLEILNLLYKKYKGLHDAATTDEERMAHHAKAQSFFTIDCIFKPWQGESHTLAGHMSENEERGDTLFIEKALAVQMFRRVYKEEDQAAAEARGEPYDGKPLTVRALADRITAQGWTVSPSHLSRFEYAANHLLPVVPTALWAGAGQPLIINLRRLEKAYAAFWATTDEGRDNPKQLLDVFYKTLEDFDEDPLDIDGFIKAMDRHIGQLLNLPAMTVRAEVGAAAAGPRDSRDSEDAEAWEPPAHSSTNDDTAASKPGSTHGKTIKQSVSSATAPAQPRTPSQRESALPDTPEAVQQAIMETAIPLAAQYDLVLDRIMLGVPSNGCNWFVVHPIEKKGGPPSPGKDDAKAAVWWALFKLSGTYRQLPSSHDVFQTAFAQYMADATPVADMVLRLYDFAIALPDEAQTHLTTLQHLVRHGDALLKKNKNRK